MRDQTSSPFSLEVTFSTISKGHVSPSQKGHNELPGSPDVCHFNFTTQVLFCKQNMEKICFGRMICFFPTPKKKKTQELKKKKNVTIHVPFGCKLHAIALSSSFLFGTIWLPGNPIFSGNKTRPSLNQISGPKLV